MLVCPKCGRKELGKATQCRACGAALPFKTVLDMPAFGAAPERRCTLCGSALPVLATRCPACQAPVQVRPDEIPTELVSAPEPPPLLDPQQEIPTQLGQVDEAGEVSPFAEPRLPAPGLATSMGTKTAAEIRAVFASSSDLIPARPELAAPPTPPLQETLVARTPPPAGPAPTEHELATLIRPAAAPPPAESTDAQARRRLEAASRAVERGGDSAPRAQPIQASHAPGASGSGPVAGVKVALQAPRRAAPLRPPQASPPPPAEEALPTEVTAAPAEASAASSLTPPPMGSSAEPLDAPSPADPHSSPTRVYPALASRVAALKSAADKTEPVSIAERLAAAEPLVNAQSTETALKPVPERPAPAPSTPPSSFAPTEATLQRPQALPATVAEMPRAAEPGPVAPIPSAPAAATPLQPAQPHAAPAPPAPAHAVPTVPVALAEVAAAVDAQAPAWRAPTEAVPVATAATAAQPPATSPPAERPPRSTCDGCGTTLLPGTKFCHECGLPLQRPLTRAFTPLASAVVVPGPRTARARLLRVRGSGDAEPPFEIVDDRVQIGRREGQLRFADDPWTSPLHAQLTRHDGVLRLRDLGSRNGVFLRLRKPQRLQDGDRICMGRQLLFYDERCALDRQVLSPTDGQGTRLLASPRAADVLRIVHLYASGAYEVVQRHQRAMTLGREGCDVNFPGDEHLSQKHARILRAGAFVVVEDLGSLNGTFVAIRGEVELQAGDEILIGNQVLRLEVDPT